MAGHLRIHGNRLQLVFKLDGKQENASWPLLPGETQRQAERRLAVEIAQAVSVPRRRDPQQRTVGDILDLWYEGQDFQRANTVRRLTHQLHRLKSVMLTTIGLSLGEIPANDLEPWMVDDVQKALKNEGLRPSTIREYIAPIQTAYAWARRRRLPDARGQLQPLVERGKAEAIEDMELPKRRDVRMTTYHICEWDELLQLLDYLDSTANSLNVGAGREAAAAHWIRSGARPSEICGLGWADVRLEDGYCELRQKTVRTRGQGIQLEAALKSKNSARRIGISATIATMLTHQREWQAHWRWKMRSRWQNIHNLVYTTHLGGPLATDDIWREIKMACKALGLPDFRPYDLRHAWKSHMRDESDWTAEDLAAYQGHSRDTGEGTYRHATNAAGRKSKRIAEDFAALENAARDASKMVPGDKPVTG